MTMDKRDMENKWNVLKNAIQEILKNKSRPKFDQELEDIVTTMVLHNHGASFYNGLREVLAHHLQSKVYPKVYACTDFLPPLIQAWNDFQTSMDIIHKNLGYMDREYVQKKKIENVYNLGLLIFRDQIVGYRYRSHTLSNILLDMVKKEKKGEVVDKLTVRAACQMLMALSIRGRSVYEDVFERPFLAQSAEFYRSESLLLLAENSASAYLKEVEQRINEESQRAKRYLDESTEPRIVQVVEEELIHKHMKAIVEMENGVARMLKDGRTEDLHCMYKLLSRVPDGIVTMASCVSTHLREEGKAIVNADESGANALNLVLSLIDLKDHYDAFLVNSFMNDPIFKKMISSDFEYFLNLNLKTPEYLSLFIYDKLKKGVNEMAEQDTELVLDKTIVLFRFLQEKDMFEHYYKRHMAKSMLHNNSAIHDS